MDDNVQLALAARRAITSCTRCDLRQEATLPVPWSGGISREVAILGEAPGRTEDKEHRPFVGPAGGVLRRALDGAGLDPDSIAYINAVCCYPSTTKTPARIHREACRIHLISQLAVVQPKFIISVGLSAYSAILPDRPDLPMKLVRSQHRPVWIESIGGLRVAHPFSLWPTWHPAATFRNPSLKKQIEEDLAAFVAWKHDALYPETCVVKKCDTEVWDFDENGVAWCQRHFRRNQGELLT